MTDLLLVLLPILLYGLVVAAVVWWRPKAILRSRRRKQVVVTLKSGGAFEGVLYESDARSLVLRNATSVADPPAPGYAVDGELLLLWSEVLYVQIP